MDRSPPSDADTTCLHLREVVEKRRALGLSNRIHCITLYLVPPTTPGVVSKPNPSSSGDGSANCPQMP